MVHKYISSKVLIDKIYDEYNIQSDDFIGRLSTWTLNVLKESKIKQTRILENIQVEFVENRAMIPQIVDIVYGVKINDKVAVPVFSDNIQIKKKYTTDSLVIGYDGNVYPDLKNIISLDNPIESNDDIAIPEDSVFGIREWQHQDDSPVTYKISNGWIHTNVEYGTCEIMCGVIPYQYDEELDILFPLIPDNADLKNLIVSYCLKNMLMRGYKHHTLTLQANNRYMNPAMAYDYYMLKARNSCNTLSPSAKKSLSEILGNTLL